MSLPYHKLVVWQRADDLFIEIHRLTHQQFPKEEKYELGSQMRKSAYSVPANLVEGTARETVREKLRFFNIASASLSETGYGLHAAKRLGYITEETYLEFEARVRAESHERAERASHRSRRLLSERHQRRQVSGAAFSSVRFLGVRFAL